MKLRTKNIVKYYKQRAVVDGVTIELNQGEIVGLLGPNGAGKTTSFYMMVGLVSPNGGNVFLGEEDITDLPMYKRAQLGIGYLAQEASIFRKMTVEDNLLSVLEMTDLNKSEQKQKCEDLLDEFGLQKIRQNIGGILSGGERRRLEIARALASDPAFLLLDEPFAGIDPIAVSDLKETIRRLNSEGLGIVISDHNVRDTMQICHKVLIISNGKTIAEGSPIEVSKNKLVKEVYLGQNFSV